MTELEWIDGISVTCLTKEEKAVFDVALLEGKAIPHTNWSGLYKKEYAVVRVL